MGVALIDYGAGNLRSAQKALFAAGAGTVAITADPDVVRRADRIVLPGVGAFGQCIGALSALPGMIDALNETVRARARPFLGICVGMQLMATRGEEFGTHAGLGWVAGTVRRMPASPGIRVPHMGWNHVEPGAHGLLSAGDAYFVHSYAVDDADPDDIAATAVHGAPFVAALRRDTMLGVQFHPEKSQGFGLDLLSRFLGWTP